MKKTVLITATLILAAITGIFAQKNSFKTAPLDVFAERYGATYERSVKENLSVLFTFKKINATNSGQLESLFFPFLTAIGGNRKTHTKGFQTEFSLRKYVGGKNGMSGFYFQPGLALGKTTITSKYYKGFLNFSSSKETPPQITNRSLNALSFRMGYQWIIVDIFTFDLGLGRNRYFSPIKNKKGDLLFNCKMGLAF